MWTKHHIGGIMNKQHQSPLFEKVVTHKNLIFEICHIVLGDGKGCHPPFLLSFLRLIRTNNIVQPFRSRTRCVYPLGMARAGVVVPIVCDCGRQHFQYLDCTSMTLFTTRTVGSLA